MNLYRPSFETIGVFIAGGTFLREQRDWNTHVLNGIQKAQEANILKGDFFSLCDDIFQALKEMVNIKIEERRNTICEDIEKINKGESVYREWDDDLSCPITGEKLEEYKEYLNGILKRPLNEVEVRLVYIDKFLEKLDYSSDYERDYIIRYGRSITSESIRQNEAMFKTAWQFIEGRSLGLENKSPQTISESQLRQFTDNQIIILRSYFIPAFKGMGKGINYFDENLLTDLKKSRTGKEYAVIAKLIQESPKVLPVVMKKPFKKWLEEFCLLIGIVNTQYKPSQLEITDTIRSEFYYLA